MSTKRAIYLRHSLIGIIVLLCLIPACYGQGEPHFTFNAGAGVSPLVGDIHNRLSNGWHVTVGGGYQFMPYFETNLQFTYNSSVFSRESWMSWGCPTETLTCGPSRLTLSFV